MQLNFFIITCKINGSIFIIDIFCTDALKSWAEKSVGMTVMRAKLRVKSTGVPEHKAPPRIRSSPPRKSIRSIWSCSCSFIVLTTITDSWLYTIASQPERIKRKDSILDSMPSLFILDINRQIFTRVNHLKALLNDVLDNGTRPFDNRNYFVMESLEWFKKLTRSNSLNNSQNSDRIIRIIQTVWITQKIQIIRMIRIFFFKSNNSNGSNNSNNLEICRE